MGGLFVLPKMHKITQNSLLKKHGIFCLTFSFLPEGREILHLFHFYGIVSGIKIPHTAGKRSLS